MESMMQNYLQKDRKWKAEIGQLRELAMAAGLSEELKWGKPCYTSEGKNIVIIQPFKDSVALMFFKGVLLKDPNGLLEEQGPNSRSAKRLSFRNPEEIEEKRIAIQEFLKEAVDIENRGVQLPENQEEERLPSELETIFEQDEPLRSAFQKLTPGRRRMYLIHFNEAQQEATRFRRIEKSRPKIIAGKGLNER